ncbi:MAG: apolipoprotein N-acyltransferase [Thermodesulfovibrionales bacterium]
MSSAARSLLEEKESSPATYIAAFVSGLVLPFAFPGRDLFFLAWFCLVPFIIYLTECPRQIAFKAGLIFGIPFFFGTQYWIYYSINHYGNLNLVLSILIILLLCLYESLYIGLFGVLLNYITKRSPFPLVLTAPVIWVCLEYARGIIITGFPWSFIGYSQYKLLPLIQISDLTGIYGISFLIVAVNSIMADFVLLAKRRRRIPLYPTVPTYLGASLLLIVFICTLSYGYYRLKESDEGKTLKVAVIQGNIEQDKKWDKQYQNSVFTTYLTLTKQVAVEKPDLIVWPETAVPFIFGTDTEFTERLTGFQKENKIPLVFGSILVKSVEDRKYRLSNGAVLLDRNGNVIYSYDKIHLVPFGEYIPLRSILFFVDRLVEGIGTYIPGDKYGSANTSIGKFPVVICYELIFPSLVRNFFLNGGDFLITITNDAWFGNTIGPVQHFYTGVFRAIENRKPVIRAANTGISGYIDSKGRIISKSSLFKRETMNEEIVKNNKITFYTKYGDIFVYICLLTIAVIIINQMFHSRSRFGGKRW